ncbi:MAG: hypothetical protein H7842_05850 [Gammaproteobacteria bacterium SHHR-1]|uniref:hypothetical protein n=1 Tax=Magnetovirga frankeli TaxID=947516 RepID=UPI00129349C7|nr:hypothetical protein D5125_03175 [gamma proteobacterium SS-5]
MQVIICHIPARIGLGELFAFAESGARSLLRFSRKPAVVDCEILEITNRRDLSQEFHGLVTYASPADGERAIKALNGKRLAGKLVVVRAYVHRRPGDRRVTADTSGLNRPENQRRQDLIIRKRSDAEQIDVRAYKDEARIHKSK